VFVEPRDERPVGIETEMRPQDADQQSPVKIAPEVKQHRFLRIVEQAELARSQVQISGHSLTDFEGNRHGRRVKAQRFFRSLVLESSATSRRFSR
jgi:hypothetical protein